MAITPQAKAFAADTWAQAGYLLVLRSAYTGRDTARQEAYEREMRTGADRRTMRRSPMRSHTLMSPNQRRREHYWNISFRAASQMATTAGCRSFSSTEMA